MSDRDQFGLHGPVRSCTEENTSDGFTDAEGKTYPPIYSEQAREFDREGRVTATRSNNSDGSKWIVLQVYDASGRLLNISSGIEGQTLTRTTYSYDNQGRLQRITNPGKPESAVTFRYDEHGKKSKIETLRPEDYHPNTASGGSPFEAVDMAPNLPGGGTATTSYDEHDRATEVQVRDASGVLVNRAVRTYDAQGHVVEEKQIVDDPSSMFPPEALAKIQEQSGMSTDQLRHELGAKITKLMGGESTPHTVAFTYDSDGRATHVRRRIFNFQQEIDTSYNEQGDVASETTRGKQVGEVTDQSSPSGPPEYSEVRYSYKYDDHENWIEKTTSYRSSPDGAFRSSPVTRRTLTYY